MSILRLQLKVSNSIHELTISLVAEYQNHVYMRLRLCIWRLSADPADGKGERVREDMRRHYNQPGARNDESNLQEPVSCPFRKQR